MLIGVYSATRLIGEQKIIAIGCKYMILRIAWLYSEFGKNFVKTMLNLIAIKPQFKEIFDHTGTPTYVWGLATTIVAALKNQVAGIITILPKGLQLV